MTALPRSSFALHRGTQVQAHHHRTLAFFFILAQLVLQDFAFEQAAFEVAIEHRMVHCNQLGGDQPGQFRAAFNVVDLALAAVQVLAAQRQGVALETSYIRANSAILRLRASRRPSSSRSPADRRPACPNSRLKSCASSAIWSISWASCAPFSCRRLSSLWRACLSVSSTVRTFWLSLASDTCAARWPPV